MKDNKNMIEKIVFLPRLLIVYTKSEGVREALECDILSGAGSVVAFEDFTALKTCISFEQKDDWNEGDKEKILTAFEGMINSDTEILEPEVTTG